LGVVLNRDVSYLKDEAEAENAIAGYCLVHDLSERDFQLNQGGQWVKGKSCPGFCPVGPYLVSRDEMKDVMDLQMNLSVNGEIRQSGKTSTMVFNPAYVIWYISQFMVLEAGDLISTGTPPCVGLGMKPPRFLKDGDVVELEIENLGNQKVMSLKYNRIVRQRSDGPKQFLPDGRCSKDYSLPHSLQILVQEISAGPRHIHCNQGVKKPGGQSALYHQPTKFCFPGKVFIKMEWVVITA